MHKEWVWVSGCLSPVYILHLFHARLRTSLLETGVLEMQGQPEQAQSCLHEVCGVCTARTV